MKARSFFSIGRLLAPALAGSMALAAASAQAGDVHWSIGIHSSGAGASFYSAPPVVYAPAPVVVYPAPVYAAPRVMYAPAPVVVTPVYPSHHHQHGFRHVRPPSFHGEWQHGGRRGGHSGHRHHGHWHR